jgi:hypothetical protein
VNELKEKAKEVKEKMFLDEREMSQIMRGPRKKHPEKKQEAAKKPAKEKETNTQVNDTVAPVEEAEVSVMEEKIPDELQAPIADVVHETPSQPIEEVVVETVPEITSETTSSSESTTNEPTPILEEVIEEKQEPIEPKTEESSS